MKLKLFILIFITTLNTIYSQNKLDTYKSKYVKVLKVNGIKGIYEVNNRRVDRVFKYNEFYYAFCRIGNKKKSHIIVKKIDENLNVVNAIKLNLSKLYYTQELHDLKNSIAISYIERKGLKYNLKIKKFDFESFSLIKNEIFVSEIKRKYLDFMLEEKVKIKRHIGFQINCNSSSNGEHLSVSKLYYKKKANTPSEFSLYDSNLKLKFTKKITLENLPEIGKRKYLKGFHVNNFGIIQGIYFIQKKSFSEKGITKIITINQDKVYFSQPTSNLLDVRTLLFSPNFKYITKNKKTIWFIYDKNSDIFLINKFELSEDFKTINKKTIDISSIILKNKDPKKYYAYRYYLKQIAIDENNNTIINLEEDYGSWDNQTQSGSSNKEDIVVVKLDSLMNLIWNCRIKKTQTSSSDSEYVSFTFFTNTDGNLCYIFNSNSKNHPGLLKKKSLIDDTIVYVLLDKKTGEIINEKIIFSKELINFDWKVNQFENFGDDFLLGDYGSFIIYNKK